MSVLAWLRNETDRLRLKRAISNVRSGFAVLGMDLSDLSDDDILRAFEASVRSFAGSMQKVGITAAELAHVLEMLSSTFANVEQLMVELEAEAGHIE